MLTATDYFCGMGGSSSGLAEAGYDVQVAANHWERAIETHSANHPDTEHLCEDIQKVDVRYLPRTDVLWASPICTELSPAGGRKRKADPGQPSLWEEYGHIPDKAFDRTRVTFWEVLRSAEVHEHKAILVENVVEAADWDLLPTWLHGWTQLGYNVQAVSVSAAHVWGEGNLPAPQWRDRLYFVITRQGIRLPDVEPRPIAWCGECGTDVQARQAWKPKAKRIAGHRVGKYGPQYIYVCPERGHAVEPYVSPAAAAIDWTDLGTRIGDRESKGMRPLGAKTLERIHLGLETVGNPALVAAGGNTWDAASGATNSYLRAWPAEESPTPAQVTAIQNGIATAAPFTVPSGGTWREDPDSLSNPMPARLTRDSDALVSPKPFVTMLRANGRPTGSGEPLRTFSTGRNHGLTTPPGAFISAHHGGYADGDPSMNKPVSEPMRTMTAQTNKSLVIPYRKGAKPYPAGSSALSTMATREQHGVLHPHIEVEDCWFRMLSPREAANAQRFARDYTILGHKGEQQMQAGNAVAVNVAHWLGRQVAEVLA